MNLNDQIVKLANQGLRAVDIAQQTGLSKTATATRLSALVKSGRLERSVHRKGSAADAARRTAFLVQRYKINVGHIGIAIGHLTMDETQWLFEQVPVGATVSEYLMMLVRDAYAEDKE